MKGTIRWYDIGKGYGFIRGNDRKDIYVHFTELLPGVYPNRNDQVEYDLDQSDRGPKAINVTVC